MNRNLDLANAEKLDEGFSNVFGAITPVAAVAHVAQGVPLIYPLYKRKPPITVVNVMSLTPEITPETVPPIIDDGVKPITEEKGKEIVEGGGAKKIFGFEPKEAYISGSLILLGAAIGAVTAWKTKQSFALFGLLGAAAGSLFSYKFIIGKSKDTVKLGQVDEVEAKSNFVSRRAAQKIIATAKVGDVSGGDIFCRDRMWHSLSEGCGKYK